MRYISNQIDYAALHDEVYDEERDFVVQRYGIEVEEKLNNKYSMTTIQVQILALDIWVKYACTWLVVSRENNITVERMYDLLEDRIEFHIAEQILKRL